MKREKTGLRECFPLILSGEKPTAYYLADEVNAELGQLAPLAEIGRRAVEWNATGTGEAYKRFWDAVYDYRKEQGALSKKTAVCTKCGFVGEPVPSRWAPGNSYCPTCGYAAIPMED